MWGEMNRNQMEEFLNAGVIGRLGCSNDDQVYVVPITYAYDNGYIYGHTKDGLKIRMMRNNPNICFEIDWVKDMSNWKSVIAYGKFEELNGIDANMGLEILMRNVKSILGKKPLANGVMDHDNTHIVNIAFQHSFLSPFLHSASKEISEIVVYRIKIIKMSGKFGDDNE